MSLSRTTLHSCLLPVNWKPTVPVVPLTLLFHCVAYGTFSHPAEDDMVFKVNDPSKVPKFSAPVFLENKTQFGVVDEIFGPVNEVVCIASPSHWLCYAYSE